MTLDNVVQVRPFNYCVVDEADSILIDEARTPLIISRKGNITDIKVLIVSKSIIQSTTNITNFIYKYTCIYICSFCNIHASITIIIIIIIIITYNFHLRKWTYSKIYFINTNN